MKTPHPMISLVVHCLNVVDLTNMPEAGADFPQSYSLCFVDLDLENSVLIDYDLVSRTNFV